MLVITAIGVLGLSCSDKTKAPEPKKQEDAAVTTAAPLDAATEPRRAMPRIPEGFAKVGIPRCDDYIAKQRKCLEEKAPPSIRKPQLLGLRQIAAKWAEANKEGQSEALAKTCELMIASSQKATGSAWGCEW